MRAGIQKATMSSQSRKTCKSSKSLPAFMQWRLSWIASRQMPLRLMQNMLHVDASPKWCWKHSHRSMVDSNVRPVHAGLRACVGGRKGWGSGEGELKKPAKDGQADIIMGDDLCTCKKLLGAFFSAARFLNMHDLTT